MPYWISKSKVKAREKLLQLWAFRIGKRECGFGFDLHMTRNRELSRRGSRKTAKFGGGWILSEKVGVELWKFRNLAKVAGRFRFLSLHKYCIWCIFVIKVNTKIFITIYSIMNNYSIQTNYLNNVKIWMSYTTLLFYKF